MERLTEAPIKAIYQQDAPNADIDFGTHRLEFPDTADVAPHPVSAHAHLRFTPKVSLEFVVPRPATDPQAGIWNALFNKDKGVKTEHVHLPHRDVSHEMIRTSRSSERIVYIPRQSPIQVWPPSTKISKAVFHLFNWPEFSGPEDFVLFTGTTPRQGAVTCGRVSFEFDDWLITISADEKTSSAVKQLAQTGGYAITHLGEISRKNGEPFSTEQLNQAIQFCSYLFSFVLGNWSGPDLSVGLTEANECVFEHWGLGHHDSGPWQGGWSWFSSGHSDALGELSRGFWTLWSSDIWLRPLTEVVYWYVTANKAGRGLGVDSALLFTQAALELLSWTYCVLDRKMVSADAFKPRGLSAADRLRLLASSLGIPLEIPEYLSALHAKRGGKVGRFDACNN